jgi:hypothetical protein
VSKKSKKQRDQEVDLNSPWIQLRSGMLAVTAVSISLALWVGWNLIPSEGYLNAALWGLGFGGSVWLIFFGAMYLTKFFRRK